MTETTRAKLPQHLRKYIVEQNYARYTPEDQAVWRYIMRQLKSFLAVHAHEVYLEGLKKSGIEVERIPRITEIDEKISHLGWGAVPVSGFIPPAAFMEFQSLGILPIASDMRSLDHLLYTPAPDIVHEAAGHAPILADPGYAAYLQQYGSVARHSILSREDLAQYDAIRILSDLKENPFSTPEQIKRAEEHLNDVNRNMKFVSEAALLSRMNWWTAEYGLIGELNNPKIFGAGLLSSVGEASACLNPKVKKIPLSVNCVDFSYDITEPQPQLFVASEFAQLGDVLEDLAGRLAYRRGGVFGLERAQEAGTVNTVQLNSGIQIAGILTRYLLSDDSQKSPVYLQFSGPCQLALSYTEIQGQGRAQHAQGYSTPLGFLKNHRRCFSTYTASDLANMGLKVNERSRLAFESGVVVEGLPTSWLFAENKLVMISWKDCRVTLGDKVLFDPSWGVYDMAVGSTISSVFGGPADRGSYGETDDFKAATIPLKSFPQEVQRRHAFYQKIREARHQAAVSDGRAMVLGLIDELFAQSKPDWLQAMEILELCHQYRLPEGDRERLLRFLEPSGFSREGERQCVKDGLALANRSL